MSEGNQAKSNHRLRGREAGLELCSTFLSVSLLSPQLSHFLYALSELCTIFCQITTCCCLHIYSLFLSFSFIYWKSAKLAIDRSLLKNHICADLVLWSEHRPWLDVITTAWSVSPGTDSPSSATDFLQFCMLYIWVITVITTAYRMTSAPCCSTCCSSRGSDGSSEGCRIGTFTQRNFLFIKEGWLTSCVCTMSTDGRDSSSRRSRWCNSYNIQYSCSTHHTVCPSLLVCVVVTVVSVGPVVGVGPVRLVDTDRLGVHPDRHHRGPGELRLRVRAVGAVHVRQRARAAKLQQLGNTVYFIL